MKKYLLLILTTLVIGCSNQKKVETTTVPTSTFETVATVEPTASPNETVSNDSDIPKEALESNVQEILNDNSLNKFVATYDDEALTIDCYFITHNGQSVELDPNLGAEIYFVPVFGEYKKNDVIGLYEDEVTDKTVLQPKKIKKAVVFYEPQK